MEMENTVRVEILSRNAHRPQLAHEEHSKERESMIQNHRIIEIFTLISKLRTFERLLILPQQLGQLPNEVEEEIVLLDRNYLLGYLHEK